MKQYSRIVTDLQVHNGQNKVAEWAGRITECRSSGMVVKTWCKQNGVCEQTYYKWQRRLFAMAQAQQVVQLAAVTPAQAVGCNNTRRIVQAALEGKWDK